MMDQKGAALRAGFLNIAELRGKTESLELRHFDMLLFCSSYEPRCLEITKCPHITSHSAYVFRFSAPSDDNSREVHAQELERFSRRIANTVERIDLPPSVDAIHVQEALNRFLLGVARSIKHPITVLIDISAFPKSYFSQIIAAGFGLGIFRRVCVFYSETDYVGGGATEGFRFTDGDWQPIQIPFLEGQLRAGLPRHSIVSVGADLSSLERFVRRYEPESMTLLAPLPGASQVIDRKVQSDISGMRRRFGSAKLAEAAAFDTVGALSSILPSVQKYSATHEIGLFCLGTKPHALAMAMAAIIRPDIPLVCRVPQRYRERKDAANGFVWIYTIYDTSNPFTYTDVGSASDNLNKSRHAGVDA